MKWNKNQAADAFGVSTQTVNIWLGKGLPYDKAKNGRYIIDSVKAIEWRYENIQRSGDRTRKHSGGNPKNRLDEIKVEMAEIDLDERRGEVIGADEALKEFGALLSDVRQRLTALPGSMAALLGSTTSPTKVKQELSAGIKNCLEEIHARYGISDES